MAVVKRHRRRDLVLHRLYLESFPFATRRWYTVMLVAKLIVQEG